MHRKNGTAVPQFVLKDRSNQELLDGAKHLVGRHRTVTAHLVAHLAEIDRRKLQVVEGFSSLSAYCVGALGLSEDEAYRRSHAAVLAQKYPVILEMLLEGSIHLTTLRIIGQCLTPGNHRQVLEAARGKSKTELEHLAAALCPRPDVPTVLRRLPEPQVESGSKETLFTGEKVTGLDAQRGGAGGLVPQETSAEGVSSPVLAPPAPSKSRLAPLSPHRYNLQVTVDEETYDALKQLQDLLRHQIRNGNLSQIIKEAVLEKLERVKREKFGHTKHARKVTRKQESWIENEKAGVGIVVEVSEAETVAQLQELASSKKAKASTEIDKRESESGAFAPGRMPVNSRHIPVAVKREVWERDKGQCAFVSRGGRRCSETGRLEFHHIHAYALGGPATAENIALFCRTHNAHEGVVLFGEKKAVHPGANRKTDGASTHPVVNVSTEDPSIRPGANGRAGSAGNAP